MTAVIDCPLCAWKYEVKPLDARLNGDTLASVFGPGVMLNIAANRQAEETETALREHLNSHKLEEWVRKVSHQQREIALLRCAASQPSVMDGPCDKCGGTGYYVAPRPADNGSAG